MTGNTLIAERDHLARLLDAIQRCAWFLDAAERMVGWPLDGALLHAHQKDVALFSALAAMNERFGKLQDTLGVAMRHAAMLLGEPVSPFLKMLGYYEKVEVVDSIASWQLCRTARNLAAHEYDTDYAVIADHFNTLHNLTPLLYDSARRFVAHCQLHLQITPASEEFSTEFSRVGSPRE